jgi:hypothetical protein
VTDLLDLYWKTVNVSDGESGALQKLAGEIITGSAGSGLE